MWSAQFYTTPATLLSAALRNWEEGKTYRRRERFRVSADKFCSADSSAAGALRASPVQRA